MTHYRCELMSHCYKGSERLRDSRQVVPFPCVLVMSGSLLPHVFRVVDPYVEIFDVQECYSLSGIPKLTIISFDELPEHKFGEETA